MTTTYKGLFVGQSATATRTFTADEIAAYSELTGDRSFDQGMVPGPMIGGIFSSLLGTKFPGHGTIWFKQHFDFLSPARVDEEITAKVQILRIRPEKEFVYLEIHALDPRGEVVCRGQTIVYTADVQSAKE